MRGLASLTPRCGSLSTSTGYKVTFRGTTGARLDVLKQGQAAPIDSKTFSEGDLKYFDGGQYAIYLSHASTSYVDVYHGTPESTKISYDPDNPRGPQGALTEWRAVASSGKMKPASTEDIVKNATVQGWFTGGAFENDRKTLVRRFQVPLTAQVATQKFLILDGLEGDNDYWLRESEFLVDPAHDVGLSALAPSSGSLIPIGSPVPVALTMTAAGGYTERMAVSVVITGPGGYVYTDSQLATVVGHPTVTFDPPWNTAGLLPGTYTIAVSAPVGNDVDPDNNSASSTVTLYALTPPVTPVLQTCTSGGPTSVTIGWSDLSSNESGFRVERSVDASAWTPVCSVGPGIQTCVDSTAAPERTYYYQVVAYNDAGWSSSNVMSVTTPAHPSVTWLYPNGGQHVQRGKTLTLNWASKGTVGDVKLELLKNGALHSTLSNSTQNTGSLIWSVPADLPIGADYAIRIQDAAAALTPDSSDSPFSIVETEYGLVIGSSMTGAEAIVSPADLDNRGGGQLPLIRRYTKGTAVELTAQPPAGGIFEKWTLAGADHSTEQTIQVSMDGDRELMAIFGGSATSVLAFSASVATVRESSGAAAVTVTRSGGTSGAVSVTVSTSDGTAGAGTDYTATSEVVTFTDGDTTPKTVNISIANDSTPETSETFTLTLSNATGGATIGTPATATITITDDDASQAQERIVFAKEEAEALYDLWMVAPDGSGLERLTDEAKNGHNSQSPILFPDGRRLVFWRDYNIFVLDLATNTATALTTDGQYGDYAYLTPRVSPDGTKVVYTYGQAIGGSCPACTMYEIWMINADGSNKTRITENSYRDGDALFSPDGMKLLITHYQGAPASDCCNATDLFVRDLATGAETLLYGTNSYDWASDWSTTGVLFLTQDGSSGIGFIQADGNGFRQVVPGGTQATGAVFSPNDAQIVFTAPTEGGRMLFLANSDGSSATPIPGTEGAYANERAGDWGMVDLSVRPPAIVVQPDHVDVPEGGTASYSVSLARQPSSDISVSVSRADGSDADLTIQGTPDLTFTTANWSQLQMVTIAAAVDADQVNGTATFLVSTAGGTPVFVSATEIEPVVLTPGVLQFSAGTHWQLESGGQATATVTRTGGSAGIVSVTVTSSDVTATSGNDYTAVSQVLTFGDGDTTPKTVDIPIINDTNPETAETFTVSLSAPTGGATIGSPATMLVTIADDDVSQGPVVLGVMETVPRNAITFIDSQGTALASIPLPAAGQMFSVSDDGSTILYSVAGTTGGDYALWTYDVATATHTYLFNAMWSQTIRWLPGSNTDFVYARSDQKLHRYSIPTATSSVWQDIDTLAPFGVNNFRGGISWDDSGSRVLVRAGRAYGGGDIVMLGRLCSADATHHICDLQAFSPTYGGSSSWTNVSYSPAMSWTGDVGYFIKRESSTNYYVIERNTVSGAERTVHSLLNDSAGLNNVVVLDPSSIAIVGPANGVFRQVLSCDAGGSGCGVIHSRSEGSLNWLESVRPVGALATWLDSQRPKTGTAAYWKLDEVEGSTVLDSSGNGNLGTAPNNAIVPGYCGNARAIPVSGGAVGISVPNSPSLDISGGGAAGAFTLEGYVFAPAHEESGLVVVLKNKQYGLLVGSFDAKGRMYLAVGDPGGSYGEVVADGLIPTGRWVHVAGTWDGTTARLYVDHVLVKSQELSASLVSSTSPVVVAQSGTATPTTSTGDG